MYPPCLTAHASEFARRLPDRRDSRRLIESRCYLPMLEGVTGIVSGLDQGATGRSRLRLGFNVPERTAIVHFWAVISESRIEESRLQRPVRGREHVGE